MPTHAAARCAKACGFELRFEELAAASASAPDAASACGSERPPEAAAASEAFAVLPPDADLQPLQQALQLLSHSVPPGVCPCAGWNSRKRAHRVLLLLPLRRSFTKRLCL